MILCCNAACIGHCDYNQYIDMMQDSVGMSSMPHDTYVDRYICWYTSISIYKYEYAYIYLYIQMYLCVHMLSDSYTQQYVCTFMLCWHTHLHIYNFSSICYTLPLTAYSYPYTIRANIYIQHKAAIHRCPASILSLALQHSQQAWPSQIGVDSCGMCA